MAFLRQHRFIDESVSNGSPASHDDDDDEDVNRTGSSMESSPAVSTSDDDGSNLKPNSMTAKGMKHLCSELLEIKKASEEDFRRNVYLNYLAFVRMFEEAGDIMVEKDSDLKRHVITQRRLVQHLSDTLYSSILVAENYKVTEKNEVNPCSPRIADIATCDILDILLSEHRMDEALELLALESQAPETKRNDGMSAWSARRARVADRFASLADNPRTPRAELLKALSALCQLGETRRANHLLFKFYRSSVIRRAEELRCSNQFLHRNYIKELACMVFSAILEASRSFIKLHGHGSAYSSELIQWAREEIEDFSPAFHEYVKSISEVSESLVLALEAAKCAFSYCSLLRPLKIFLEADLIELIVPCMEEVLTMYAKHLKGVIGLLVASDAWVLGRFLISGILRVRSSTSVGEVVEHCLLTSSGRKFVTLLQEVVEDITPVLNLGMKKSVVHLVAELFREYMQSIIEAIARKEGAFQNEAEADTSCDHRCMKQLSVLINCTTVVALFPIIANGIFKGNEATSPSCTDFSTQRELDDLISFIREAAGQVWTCFCQQFIQDTMSTLQSKPRASFEEQIFARCLPSSPQDMMPSFAFQVLFLRARQLNKRYGTMLTSGDGTKKKLLQELMEVMIFWLSNNLDSWIRLENHPKNVPKNMLFDQIHLDVHFLLEFAQVGGYSSDFIRAAAADLLKKAEEKVSSLEQDINCIIREDGWAANAAKHAVNLLMGPEVNSSDSIEEQNTQDGIELDDSVVGSGQNNSVDTTSNENVYLPGEQTLDGNGAWGCDGKSLSSSSNEFISIEDDCNAIEGSTNDDMSEKVDLAGILLTPQVLGSEKEEHVIVLGDKLLKDIPKDAHYHRSYAGVGEICGGPDATLPGSGGSEGSEIHAGIEITPSYSRDEIGDHDSSCSFTTTSPESLQDSTPMVSADEGTSPGTRNVLHKEMIEESLVDTMNSTNTKGKRDADASRGNDGGCPTPSRVVQSSSRRTNSRNSTRPAENTGEKREALGRSRPRWQ